MSVKAATTLSGRLVREHGTPVVSVDRELTHVFPTAATMADADLSRIGVTAARREALRQLATAVIDGTVRLEAAHDLANAEAQLCKLPGVGAWTAQYIAMRALREPDAFPASDLGLRKAFTTDGNLISPRQLMGIAEAWRPWRAYAAMHLWMSLDKRESNYD